MWNRKLYLSTLDCIVKQGEFKGQKVATKQKLYDLLSEQIHAGSDAIKSWTREKSNGPGDDDLREALEEALALPIGALYISKKTMNGGNSMNITLTDFCKKNVMDCYGIMKAYIRSDDMESAECFTEMCLEIDKRKVGMPKIIFDKIEAFVNENLAPIIYEREDVFAECYSEKLGRFDEDGTFCLISEEATYQFIINFMKKLAEIEELLEKFGMEELHPYLV